MDDTRKMHLSKFLSFVLRHKPEEIGIQLDEAGWAEVEALLQGCEAKGYKMTAVELDEVVRTNPKRRFAFDDSQTRIRANQGHSVDVSLGYQEQVPPKHLFHGTVERFVYSIENEGIRKGERHHVHLSSDLETAKTVGSRRGSPLIFRVAAAAMAADGYRFYRSDNGVWLTEHVPPKYLSLLTKDGLEQEASEGTED